MTGSARLESRAGAPVPSWPDPTRPGLASDYNGDGMSDILIRDGNGNTAMWLMNGTSVLSNPTVGNVPTTWNVQSLNAE